MQIFHETEELPAGCRARGCRLYSTCINVHTFMGRTNCLCDLLCESTFQEMHQMNTHHKKENSTHKMEFTGLDVTRCVVALQRQRCHQKRVDSCRQHSNRSILTQYPKPKITIHVDRSGKSSRQDDVVVCLFFRVGGGSFRILGENEREARTGRLIVKTYFDFFYYSTTKILV